MRTDAEIQVEIKWLKENKPKIGRWDSLGADNHAAIDAQIKTLEQRADDVAIYDWADIENWDHYATRKARDAAEWLEGYDECKPSAKDNWGGLVK